MDVPGVWAAVLLGLAAFRVYRLIAEDTILDRPRKWLLRGPLDTWEKDGDDTGPDYRLELGLFISCPWCLGAWISIGWWVLWLIFPTEAVFVAVPFAISAFVALVSKNLDRNED